MNKQRYSTRTSQNHYLVPKVCYQQKYRRRLLLETLEERQLLAGDVPPLFNFNTVPNPSASAFPVNSDDALTGYLSEFNGSLLVAADDGIHGSELWKSDGTAQGTQLVKDIFPGPETSWVNVQLLYRDRSSFQFGGNAYLGADNGANGWELWKTDGTESGTEILKDINPGPAISDFRDPTQVGNVFYFGANNGANGYELWRSDGTQGGTALFKDIRPGAGSAGPTSLVNVNGTLFFEANDGSTGRELWKSDGTPQGTVLVRDIRLGTGSSSLENLTNLNGTLYFVANNGIHGKELWRSDGTLQGTVMVKDIRPGSGNSFYAANAGTFITNVNGTLYFAATDGTHGIELWKSNGTAEGTVMVKDILSGPYGSGPIEITNVDGMLYFSALDATSGSELWKSDGTPQGTLMVKKIGAAIGSYPRILTNVSGVLYFTASEAAHGRELWRSDGTENGTEMVINIAAGSASSSPRNFVVIGNKLYFHAFTATYGRELYVIPLDSVDSSISGSHVYHVGSSFANSGVETALDSTKQLAKEGAEPQTLSYDNLVNSSRGINGLVFDIENLPGSPSSSLTAADFEFQMSPTGAFVEAEHPPTGWSGAPTPSSISFVAGSPGSPDRVILQWPDNAIANRWLRITVKATPNTGLAQPEVYYIGHLLGETTDPSGGVYTVSFADITPIRSAVGQSVNAGSIHDIDKNGTVSFADISAMRPNVGTQLTNITIPAGNNSSGESGGEIQFSPQSGTGKGGVGGAGRSSLLQMPALPMSSTLPTTPSRPMASWTTLVQTHSGLPENKAILKAEGLETRDPWLGEMDVLLEDAAIVRYWTSESAVEEEAGIELQRLNMESSLKSQIAPPVR